MTCFCVSSPRRLKKCKQRTASMACCLSVYTVLIWSFFSLFRLRHAHTLNWFSPPKGTFVTFLLGVGAYCCVTDCCFPTVSFQVFSHCVEYRNTTGTYWCLQGLFNGCGNNQLMNQQLVLALYSLLCTLSLHDTSMTAHTGCFSPLQTLNPVAGATVLDWDKASEELDFL